MYNCERYIADCLESILQIDLPTDDYEVIVINDGSTDNSLALVNNFAERYHNIHCMTTSNQGQAAARNTGIKQSKGRYLWFVDADDKIDADEFQKAYSELWKQEASRKHPFCSSTGSLPQQKAMGAIRYKQGCHQQNGRRRSLSCKG